MSVSRPCCAACPAPATLPPHRRKRLYTTGRYHVGLARSFFLYPTNYQNVEFSNSADADAPGISIRVTGESGSGGGTLRIDVSFQYLLDLPHLISLYKSLELNFQSRIVDEARDVLAATAQNFATTDYFQRRDDIREAFLQGIRGPLLRLHVVPVDLQLRRIVLSEDVEESILNKAVSRQQVLRSEFTNRRLDLEAQQNVAYGQGNETVRTVRASLTAQAKITVNGANARATAIDVGATAFAANALQQGTNFTTNELLYYRWLQDIVAATGRESSIVAQLEPTALL